MHFHSPVTHRFDRIVSFVARLPLTVLTALVAIVGIAVFIYGVIIEINGELALLHQGGRAAVEAYRASLQIHPIDNFAEYLFLGLTGQIHSFGGNEQAVGQVIIYGGSPLLFAIVMTARGLLVLKARTMRPASRAAL